MRKLLQNLRQDEIGASLPEYALLLGLILAIAAGTLTTLGGNINTIFTNVQTAMAAAAG